MKLREILVSKKNWCKGNLARRGVEGEERLCALGHVGKAYGLSFEQMQGRSCLNPTAMSKEAQACLGNLFHLQFEVIDFNDEGRARLETRFKRINALCETHELPFRFRVMEDADGQEG